MRPPTSRWLPAVAAALTAAALTACGSSDPASPAPAGPSASAPADTPASTPASTPAGPSSPSDEAADSVDGLEQASDPFSPKSFCEGYNAVMGVLLQGGDTSKQILTGFQAILVMAPEEFRGWAGDMAPWVQAQIDNDSAAINEHAPASEDAAYQISNKCQFVLADS